MSNEKRYKLIVEALGGCWHDSAPDSYESVKNGTYGLCLKCGKLLVCENSNLSTPEGFFWAWDRAKEKEWWGEFLNGEAMKNPILDLINPGCFANALAEFLEGRK